MSQYCKGVGLPCNTAEHAGFCACLPGPFVPRVLKLSKGLKKFFGNIVASDHLDAGHLFTEGLFNM